VIKNRIHQIAPGLYGRLSVIWNAGQLLRAGQLVEDGYFESIRRRSPVDQGGEPIPWYTYALTAFLEERCPPGLRVFEYGSGNSTLWWAKRASSVVSVEHDAGWVERIGHRLPATVALHQIGHDQAGYFEAPKRFGGDFDVVVVDGRRRSECAMTGVECLSGRGVLIFDDSDRDRYQECIGKLRDRGLHEVFFSGMRPFGRESTRSSIFYRPGNCLAL
jgi:hypothetical protein